jgi:hypothetical protein
VYKGMRSTTSTALQPREIAPGPRMMKDQHRARRGVDVRDLRAFRRARRASSASPREAAQILAAFRRHDWIDRLYKDTGVVEVASVECSATKFPKAARRSYSSAISR